MTVLISVKIAGENEHFPHIFVTQDSDKLVKYFETKYAPYKVEMCEAVWKSNFRRPTPSTRHCPRDCICSMVWRLYAIDATLD